MRGRSNKRIVHRAMTLIVAAAVLYGVAPVLLEVLGDYRRLHKIDPPWWIVVLGASIASGWCMCALQRLALNRAQWFPVTSSQLAGNAFSKVVPGGSAAAAALQARMLIQAGFSATEVGTGLAAGALLLLCALAGLPLLALPALLFGQQIPTGLLETGGIQLGVFVALSVIGVILLVNDRALLALGRTVQTVERLLRRWREPSVTFSRQLIAERDRLRGSLGRAWPQAIALASGRWIFDFLCLYGALLAVGARPPLYVALLAYAAVQLLGQIPLTPGGLGVVEAGLTATLALAGVGTARAALATLAFRLATYWLSLPVGLGAWLWHRKRYEKAATHAG